MCWNAEASAVLAVAGIASATVGFRKGEPRAICYALLFFSLMEVIQTFTYFVIDECMNPANVWSTRLAYFHIALQPFFFNAIALHFIPEPTRQRIQKPVYAICLLCTIAIIVRVLPLEWQRYCYNIIYHVPFFENIQYRFPFCGKETCSVSGEWHMKWQIVAGYNWWLDRSYFFAVFLMPLLYGSWKALFYGILTGPLLAGLTTNNTNEFAAVWCLYSVGILLIMFNTPLRQKLYVDSFYGYKKSTANTDA